MDISIFFYSYLGMYLTQSISHALISAIIVEMSIHTWKIDSPLIRQRFRYIVIISPLVLFPIYQVINPERGTISFRMEALFDSNRWLNLELWGKFPLSFIFVLILFMAALICFLQELIPVLRHTIESKKALFEGRKPDKDSVVHLALESLHVEKPDIFLIDDKDVILFSSTGENSSIFMSTGLADALNMEQIRAALAHEIAHITRSRKPLILILFLLRVLMFFNPIVLLEFRKVVQEDEQICDDDAVALMQRPRDLAETLKKFLHVPESLDPIRITKPSKLGTALEEYSHNILIKNRIMRLEQGLVKKADDGWPQFAVTLMVIIIINYFIV